MSTYRIVKNKTDSDMYEAFMPNKVGGKQVEWLAFIIHTDLLPDDVKRVIDDDGEAIVSFYLEI